MTRIAALRPAALVLNDFSPTMLMAAATARLRGIPYGLRTDGDLETDPGSRSPVRRFTRRLLAGGAAVGIGPSQSSRRLLESYGLTAPFWLAPLFPAWRADAPPPASERPFDLLFCGTLMDEKGARFFTDVVLGCVERGGRPSVRIVGDGPMRQEMAQRLGASGLTVRFDGFLQQDALAEAYGSARLFHFPTRGDVWGIVVQEALQSGTVVMASPHAGATREILQPGRCGVVLPLDVAAWATATLDLLRDTARQDALRAAGAAAIGPFTPERACQAYVAALRPFLSPGHAPSRAYGPKSTSSV